MCDCVNGVCNCNMTPPDPSIINTFVDPIEVEIDELGSYEEHLRVNNNLSLRDYQTLTGLTAQFERNSQGGLDDVDQTIYGNYSYLFIGLMGELGELSNQFAKKWRDSGSNGDLGMQLSNPEFLTYCEKELGDILWFYTQLVTYFGFDLSTIAKNNVLKLIDRKKRNVIGGNGDNR